MIVNDSDKMNELNSDDLEMINGGKFVSEEDWAKAEIILMDNYSEYLHDEKGLRGNQLNNQVLKGAQLYDKWMSDNEYHTAGEFGLALFNLPIGD